MTRWTAVPATTCWSAWRQGQPDRRQRLDVFSFTDIDPDDNERLDGGAGKDKIMDFVGGQDKLEFGEFKPTTDFSVQLRRVRLEQ